MTARIVVRAMRDEDARSFLEVHHAAVRGIAAKDYANEVIDDWAPLPITQENVSNVIRNPDNEIRVLAEVHGEVAGIGALVLEQNELRACYVVPGVSRSGVGSALVREIESIARGHGLTFLQLDSSITARSFYEALGYEVLSYGEHILGSGRSMACVKMEKRLVSP